LLSLPLSTKFSSPVHSFFLFRFLPDFSLLYWKYYISHIVSFHSLETRNLRPLPTLPISNAYRKSLFFFQHGIPEVGFSFTVNCMPSPGLWPPQWLPFFTFPSSCGLYIPEPKGTFRFPSFRPWSHYRQPRDFSSPPSTLLSPVQLLPRLTVLVRAQPLSPIVVLFQGPLTERNHVRPFFFVYYGTLLIPIERLWLRDLSARNPHLTAHSHSRLTNALLSCTCRRSNRYPVTPAVTSNPPFHPRYVSGAGDLALTIFPPLEVCVLSSVSSS